MKYGSISRRKRTQPLGERSAGSVFRNPSELGVVAAELIEKAGLKGFREDGAMISNIHANFFINAGGSTSQDMLDRIALAKEKVGQKFGVQLREEIIHVQPYSDGLITTEANTNHVIFDDKRQRKFCKKRVYKRLICFVVFFSCWKIQFLSTSYRLI